MLVTQLYNHDNVNGRIESSIRFVNKYKRHFSWEKLRKPSYALVYMTGIYILDQANCIFQKVKLHPFDYIYHYQNTVLYRSNNSLAGTSTACKKCYTTLILWKEKGILGKAI